MLKKRLVAVLILRNGEVVQSVRFKHTNVIHYNPVHAVESFNKWVIDEIAMINVSPDIESRYQFAEKVRDVSEHCFVPLMAGGWITDVDYAQLLLRSGADKLVINSILSDNPELVTQLSNRYGRQCIVSSIDVKHNDAGQGRVAVDRGKRIIENTAPEWAQYCEKLGCGEILFNSIDHDGARKGYDLQTLEQLCKSVNIPVIAFGGVFHWKHLVEGINAGADAAAAANIFHYTEHATKKAKSYMARSGVFVRQEGRMLG